MGAGRHTIVFFAVFLSLLASAHAGFFEPTHTGTIVVNGGQYINFSSGTAGASGDVMWDNRSGILIVNAFGGYSTTSDANGFFNSTPEGMESLGPNLNLSKIYKVPLESGSTTFGDTFYVQPTHRLYQEKDGYAVLTNNNTYAAFIVASINKTNGNDNALNITVSYMYNANGSNLLYDRPSTGCAKHLNETACYDSAFSGASCYWDFWLDACNEATGPVGGAGGGAGGGGAGSNFVDCIKFDGNLFACKNISVCSYTEAGDGGLCDPTADFSYEVGLNCSTFNSAALCNNQQHTRPLCTWNGSIASPLDSDRCLENSTKTTGDIPPALFGLCDGATSELLCTNLTNSSYMQCEWFEEVNKCKISFDSIFGGASGGGFGSIFDISNQASCNAIGGTWKTETYSFVNQYGQTQTATDSWCEPSFGDYAKESCDDSCWACEFQEDGSAWATVADAKAACKGSAVGYCAFYEDPNAPPGSGNQARKGWCEPDSKVSFGFIDCSSSCGGCFTNSSCAASTANCTWTADPFSFDLDGNGSFDNSSDGWCDPGIVADKKNCDKSCFGCITNDQCSNSPVSGGCTWNSNFFFCQPTGGAEVCFFPGDEDDDGLFDCQDPDCSTDPACGYGFGGKNSLGGKFTNGSFAAIDPGLCIQHDDDQAGCEAQTAPAGTPGIAGQPICYYHPAPGQETQFPTIGWCDPVFNKEFAGEMLLDAPPVILSVDAPGDAREPWLDIVGFGIHDSPDTIDIGIAIQNITNFTGCYKAYKNVAGRVNGSGKYYRYFDVDGNTTNSCGADNDISIAGFEYKFVHSANNNASNASIYPIYNSTFDNTLSYKCVSGNWVPFAAQVNTMPDACSFGTEGGQPFGGVDVLLIKKSDIGSPKVPVRIYVATHNGSNVSMDSAGPSYYTPGSVDAKFENCAATGQDFDGDGLVAENDPDCQKFIKLGYIPFEGGPACNDGVDNDGNGLTDCADFSCKYDPYAGCGFGFTCDPSDKTSPQIKWQQADKFPDGATIAFDSNEPANGTVIFYHNDSKCITANATLLDVGLLNSFSDDDYKQWHDIDIDSASLGYGLSPNTTYYYKYRMSDLCGNTLISKCSNFTTKTSFDTFIFKPTLPKNITMTLPQLNITNNTFQYGKKLNQSDTKNVEVMINDTFNNYGITLQNCSVTEAFDTNLSGAFIYNDSTKAVGMDSDKWYEVSHDLGCKNIKIKVPNSGDQLWHCDETNVTNCYRVDNASSVSCTFASGFADCTMPVAQGLGFSVYETRTAPSSPSPPPSSSGGGGGGGGGGGVAVAATFAAQAARVWDVIAANEQKVFSVKNEKISVSTLTFAISKEGAKVEVVIGTLKELPSDVVAPPITTYQHLQITHANVKSSDVIAATIEFSVPLSWLSDNGAAGADVSLYRYDDSAERWSELQTALLSTDAESAYYSASSPGLSYFAIGAKPRAAPAAEPEIPEEQPAEPPQQQRPVEVSGQAVSEPAPVEKGRPWILYAALTLLVVAIAFVVERKAHLERIFTRKPPQ